MFLGLYWETIHKAQVSLSMIFTSSLAPSSHLPGTYSDYTYTYSGMLLDAVIRKGVHFFPRHHKYPASRKGSIVRLTKCMNLIICPSHYASALIDLIVNIATATKVSYWPIRCKNWLAFGESTWWEEWCQPWKCQKPACGYLGAKRGNKRLVKYRNGLLWTDPAIKQSNFMFMLCPACHP